MSKNTIIIGISGASASGKSVLANTIVDELKCQEVAVISEDSYYKNHVHLPFAEREKINYDHPDSIDYELMLEQLTALQRGQCVDVPVYDYANHARSDQTRKVGPHSIIVLEGILLFVEQQLRDMMDMRIFVDAPLDICLIRRLTRDMMQRKRTLESVLDQYTATVRPMFLQFIEPSKRYADIVVPRGGENRIAIDLIKAKMKELLNGIP